jgi:hypothetical protein
MSAGDLAVIVIAAVSTAALLGWFVMNRKHPEAASGHRDPQREESSTDRHHSDVNDRPAGPGAEADGVAGRGQVAPGPSAEALDEV